MVLAVPTYLRKGYAFPAHAKLVEASLRIAESQA